MMSELIPRFVIEDSSEDETNDSDNHKPSEENRALLLPDTPEPCCGCLLRLCKKR